MIKPYPSDWHRGLDFLPPLGLQVVVGDKDLELYHCATSVSVKATEMPRMKNEAKTEFGSIKVSPVFRNQIDYVMGSADPRNSPNPISQREIYSDIYNNLGGAMNFLGEMNIADVIIKSRGVVERIPKEVESDKEFQGSEYMFYEQNAYGNFPHKVREALGLMVANPYRFMKADLMEGGVISNGNDPVLKKLRSTLKTEYIVTDTGGWMSLGDKAILKAELASKARKWWADIGKPTPFSIPFNHKGVEGQVFSLLRRKVLVAV